MKNGPERVVCEKEENEAQEREDCRWEDEEVK